MELLYILTIFSLLGFIGVIIYLLRQNMRDIEYRGRQDFLKEKVERLEFYLFQLEEKVNTPSDEVKEKIIQMYIDGKTIFDMEERVNIPRHKIEEVLKAYKSKAKENIFG